VKDKAVFSKPEIMYGKPVIVGTHIPVDLILERLASGSGELFDDKKVIWG